ncbi:MAG: asparagine synthase (glutamine-hydrolyzing) [Negativicutes bacterium]
MCGIIGIVANRFIDKREWLKHGRDAMIHRGPDDAGEWWSADGRVGLAHRRLSIIDLTPAGHQPMQDSTGALTIVFNGEIYNFKEIRIDLQSKGHKFRSQSDTEVLLAAYREWGTGCLTKLNGIFAFALHDAATQTLFLARDRAGEKPLFYAINNKGLKFASELKGLIAEPGFARDIDHEALDSYLARGYIAGERCMLRGVNKLPPAHALLFDCVAGTSKIWEYWVLPEAEDRGVGCIDERMLLDELESLLEDAVCRQMVADVPVGILLSGGVDSSLVTAMAVRSSDKVKTFTVSFPGSLKYDESEHARLIACHFGTEHVELRAENIGTDLLPLLARQFDEPMVDSSMIPTYLVSQLVRKHCTVALGGDGGDELFGGYGHYNRLLSIQRKFGWVPASIRKSVAMGAGALLPVGLKGRNWLQLLGSDLDRSLPLAAVLFDASTRQQLMHTYGSWPVVAERVVAEQVPKANGLLQRATRMDFHQYLTEDILVKVDRVSMLNSLEVRAPLLDYRIVEFAFGRVPSHLKTTVNERKILLKKLATRVLPAAFDQQRKQGFSIPLADWLKTGPWREMFNDVLLDGQCLFDRKTVTELLRGQDFGRSNSERLFGLVLFELWRREYRAGI